MEKEILSVMSAIKANRFHVTNDRLEALTKGHGMLNITVTAVANALTKEILDGASIKINNPNFSYMPLDNVVKIGVAAAKEAGADAVNAALITAVLLNLVGTKSRAGVPAGNRKLGALARIAAGADRSGVSTIPTGKRNCKVSGFAAVKALYEAMEKSELVQVDGDDIPPFVSGSTTYGHGALGEDYTYVDLALNGTKIAVEGMKKAYRGVGVAPSPVMCALLAAAAVLEIVNPDGAIDEKYGDYNGTGVGYLVGKGAAEAAGLPEKLHLRGTGKEYDTAVVIGDIGMILKDVGSPTVVGMICLNDILASFAEGPQLGAGSGAGPHNSPIGHLSSDTVITMNALLDNNGDIHAAADVLKKVKSSGWLDPEVATICINLIAHKGEQVRRGLVTQAMITATEGIFSNAIYSRAKKAYNELKAGKALEDVCLDMDRERKANVEKRAGEVLSQRFGKDISVHLTKMEPCARRNHPFCRRYWSFDPNIDAEVTIDGKKVVLEGFVHKVVPDVVLNKKKELALPVSIVTPVVGELTCASVCTLNAVVPAAMATVMGLVSWEEAGKRAEKGASTLTAGIPGLAESAKEIARISLRLMDDFK